MSPTPNRLEQSFSYDHETPPPEPIPINHELLHKLFHNPDFNKKLRQVIEHTLKKRAEAGLIVYAFIDPKTNKTNLITKIIYGTPPASSAKDPLFRINGNTPANIHMDPTPPASYKKSSPLQIIFTLHTHPSPRRPTSMGMFSDQDLIVMETHHWQDKWIPYHKVLYHPNLIEAVLTFFTNEETELLAISYPQTIQDTRWQMPDLSPQEQEEALKEAGFTFARHRFPLDLESDTIIPKPAIQSLIHTFTSSSI